MKENDKGLESCSVVKRLCYATIRNGVQILGPMKQAKQTAHAYNSSPGVSYMRRPNREVYGETLPQRSR